MEYITTSAGIKNAIQNLEVEQSINGQVLKQQFHLFVESLKPVNLIKVTVHDIASSHYMTDNILGASIVLATGYLSKKLSFGRPRHLIKKILDFMLPFGTTNLVAQPLIRKRIQIDH
ncbi:MAG TPA: hypothetical protein VFC65_01555 [Prolixibacteraceae bacterium]|nr:hypothetical protein [Prolixibacteraceae bacterium]